MAGRVYAVGGFNSTLRERTVVAYDGARDRWSAAASMKESRSTLGVAVLYDLLYAVGGFNGNFGTVGTVPALLYDPGPGRCGFRNEIHRKTLQPAQRSSS